MPTHAPLTVVPPISTVRAQMQAVLTLVRIENGGVLPRERVDRIARYAGTELIYRVYPGCVQMTAIVQGEDGPETWNYDAHIGKRLGTVRQWLE